ncbi:MAG: histidine ammonia-lyase [Rhodospirillales bacterium]|nr:histidine ammonia-lyase [Rhodospirillales bacterium]
MTETFVMTPGVLGHDDIRRLRDGSIRLVLDEAAWPAVDVSAQLVLDVADSEDRVYGINTGFGSLARTAIPRDRLLDLQRRIVLSHAAGTGEALAADVVRLVLALKINALARGFSGCQRTTIEALIALYNAAALPVVPSKGSVGASGDLAPLAHLSAVLMGVGDVRMAGDTVSAAVALERIGIKPIAFCAKEGLALLNGTQVSTALALDGLYRAQDNFGAAMIAGAMSVDASLGADTPFDPRISDARGQPGQIEVAAIYRGLLEGSEIRKSHEDCDRVQDPYSLRCQPQVMGACLDHLRFAAGVLLREANAVTDNPLVFAAEGDVLSGGNFHAEPVAMAADVIALALSEIGSLSERRMALLTDSRMSELPPFLVEDSGVNSGFMVAQVTAAALAAENKQRATPVSIDSLPTSANQEDHVSMATHGARRLAAMNDNLAEIVAIELLGAAQGIDFRKPLKTSPPLAAAHGSIRDVAAFWDQDRLMAPDIAAVAGLVRDGETLSVESLDLA